METPFLRLSRMKVEEMSMRGTLKKEKLPFMGAVGDSVSRRV